MNDPIAIESEFDPEDWDDDSLDVSDDVIEQLKHDSTAGCLLCRFEELEDE